VKEGYITVTPINMDMTHYRMLEQMHGVLEKLA